MNTRTRCPEKNGALACCYSRANAPLFVGHLVDVSTKLQFNAYIHSIQHLDRNPDIRVGAVIVISTKVPIRYLLILFRKIESFNVGGKYLDMKI